MQNPKEQEREENEIVDIGGGQIMLELCAT